MSQVATEAKVMVLALMHVVLHANSASAGQCGALGPDETTIWTDPDAWVSGFQELCGEPVLLDKGNDIEWTAKAGKCEFTLVPSRGVFSIRVKPGLDDSWSSSLPSDDALEVVRQVDLEFIHHTIGIPAGQLHDSHTAVIARQVDKKTALGLPSAPEYGRTKTIVGRMLDSWLVPQDRVVVTRNLDGDVVAITGTWPKLSLEWVDVPESIDADKLAALSDADAIAADAILLRGHPTKDAIVLSGRIVVEKVVRRRGHGGPSKVQSFYIADGQTLSEKELP